MRTVAMCFSLMQFPRCRIHTLSSSWWGCFQQHGQRYTEVHGSKVHCLNKYDPEGGFTRKWIRRTVTTKTLTGKGSVTKKTTIQRELTNETLGTSTNAYTPEITELESTQVESVQYYNIQQVVAENKDISKFVTYLVFDIETTGFSRENDRIIEIAIQDLRGGKNSTFQTLVNPGCAIPNSHVHHIYNSMVNRNDVPRMEDLIPILLQYVRSRQKPSGYVVWIAHNARVFDVPFLIKEFNRHSFEIPSNWSFIDTLPLARELIKSGGENVPPKASVQALREHFEIPQFGAAHRALSDVRCLSLIFQRLIFLLKYTASRLIEKHSFSFRDFDSNSSKKKSSG
ncbi:hypothetical protein LIER_21615 [Lithospermum erythrorhizon]|uniref:Exonuclease domain-containing protein n=1 Tax=Lithospermum erythrorhizon TaxID=34254 RepID=A0AAV3QWL7_LITER